MGVLFVTYLRRHWEVQRDVVTTSPRRLVAGWDISNLATKASLNTIENKIPDVGNLF